MALLKKVALRKLAIYIGVSPDKLDMYAPETVPSESDDHVLAIRYFPQGRSCSISEIVYITRGKPVTTMDPRNKR